MKQFSLLEIVSTVVLLANVVVVVDLDSATLQAAHRCTHAPHGILAVLPTAIANGASTKALGTSQAMASLSR